MGCRSNCKILTFIVLFYTLIQSKNVSSIDVITHSQGLFVGETLVSPNHVFELGFFNPGNSSKLYIGLWYRNFSSGKVLWVANRENPVPVSDIKANFGLSKDGNLAIFDAKQSLVWSTNISVSGNLSVSSVTAVLLDNGNLVLKDGVSDQLLWESFDYPCDTFLPGMMIGLNAKTGEKRFLTSWKDENDPSPGEFIAGVDRKIPPEAVVWNKLSPYWRSGQWNGLKFVGLPYMDARAYLDGFNLIVDNQKGTEYFTFNPGSNYIVILTVRTRGSLQIMKFDDSENRWDTRWDAFQSPCDVYGACGVFGVCNKNKNPICECLKGFVPKSSEEWRRGNWSGGCVRRVETYCNKYVNKNFSSKKDEFWKFGGVKLPNFADYMAQEYIEECRDWCLNNCSCVAYAYVPGIRCMVWTQRLLDVQWFPKGGETLFIRLANSEFGKGKSRKTIIICSILVPCLILAAVFLFGACWFIAKYRAAKARKGAKRFDLAEKINISEEIPPQSLWKNTSKHEDPPKLPMFDFNEIAAATNNFSEKNKLGEGGFGLVYKGKLQECHEIVVKRLSKWSGQGIEEFKNEIALISNLQHRNLVRLFGCCIKHEEMLIIYEYMPNKSLDTFLFDPMKKLIIDWRKRFDIINGAAKGLLYLHRDSCLKIIHRDLKASNILLDQEMNPKISDFGLARTFQGKQEIANTRRVAGTIVYMSPEYAMKGFFSEKSDVFSFGVLMLEIISGKKNNFLNHGEEEPVSMVGFVSENSSLLLY